MEQRLSQDDQVFKLRPIMLLKDVPDMSFLDGEENLCQEKIHPERKDMA
jgi:hypothetical protein